MRLLNITKEVRINDEIFRCGDSKRGLGESNQSKGEVHVLHVRGWVGSRKLQAPEFR